MEEGKVPENSLTSAGAFVGGGIQEAFDDACSICLEAFCDNDPSTVCTRVINIVPFCLCDSMEEGKVPENSLTSAAAFVGGGIQEAFDDACIICLEAFCDNDTSTVTSCKHEFHLQCILK